MKSRLREKNDGTRSFEGGDLGGGCVNQSRSGNRCFVGCFIPDGHEGLELPGGVYTLTTAFPELKSVLPLDIGGLIDMASVHDEHRDISDVRDAGCAWIDENVEDSHVA